MTSGWLTTLQFDSPNKRIKLGTDLNNCLDELGNDEQVDETLSADSAPTRDGSREWKLVVESGA